MSHRVERSVETSCPQQRAFDYVSDFSTTQEWDPGISFARRLDNGPIGVGSRFELRSRFGSREQTILYEITAYEPPNTITLLGDGKTFRGTDVISFAAREGGGTRVRYVAHLSLKGLATIVVPFITGKLDEMSDRAMAGLAAALDARA